MTNTFLIPPQCRALVTHHIFTLRLARLTFSANKGERYLHTGVGYEWFTNTETMSGIKKKIKKRKEFKIVTSDHKALSHIQGMTMPRLLSDTQTNLFGTASVHSFTLLPLPRSKEGEPEIFLYSIQLWAKLCSLLPSCVMFFPFEALSPKCITKNKA